jgi:hypothetical protein
MHGTAEELAESAEQKQGHEWDEEMNEAGILYRTDLYHYLSETG